VRLAPAQPGEKLAVTTSAVGTVNGRQQIFQMYDLQRAKTAVPAKNWKSGHYRRARRAQQRSTAA
jgi:hypothetical protein